MAKYLISFPSAAMVVPDGEWGAVGRDAHAVMDEAKAAGVYVFGGGIDEDVPPVHVSASGTAARGGVAVGASHDHQIQPPLPATFGLGERVRKKSGAAWQGHIVGWYSTKLTPEGYAVESEAHPGSVQIYPVAALERVA